MSLFVSYSFAEKNGQTGFGYCAVAAQEPRGLDDVDKIIEAIKREKPLFATIVIVNWKLFATDPPT